MRWFIWFSLLCLAGLAILLAVLAAFGWLSEIGHDIHFAIAVTLGVLLSSALGGLLMGLIFYSHRSGADERAAGDGSNRRGPESRS